uniref:Bm1223 n=1 Tax=Brugia malayi TaxID=6279 RepID=A0A1I9G110_BRUMA|nr:Bm1223 [Brugia malayi]
MVGNVYLIKTIKAKLSSFELLLFDGKNSILMLS